MPKRQKESKLLPGEGRPTGGLSLADFLVPSQRGTTTKTSNQIKDEDFPSLGAAPTATISPVAAVASTSSSTNSSVAVATSATPASETNNKTLPYSITKTKKGSLPVRLESRNKGKKVTVIFNVSGDARELLKELKHAAGCGGVIREDTVELQGEKVDLVEMFIRNKMNWKKIIR